MRIVRVPELHRERTEIGLRRLVQRDRRGLQPPAFDEPLRTEPEVLPHRAFQGARCDPETCGQFGSTVDGCLHLCQTARLVDEAVARARAFNPLRSEENIRSRLRHALRETPEGRWTYKFDPAIGGGGLESDFERLWEQVKRITCPTLLVRGAQSAILARETAARFTHELPGSTVVEVPNAGHSVMGDNPSGFVAAVRPFLARHGL